MTPAMFEVLQQYLIQAYWPFIDLWLIAFLVMSTLTAIFITFLVVSRELLTRLT
jgi:hypothetical protein